MVVADQRSPRDGRVIETIGHYNAHTDPSTIVIDEERARSWLARGAQPSDTVRKLLRIQGIEYGDRLGPRLIRGRMMPSEFPKQLLEYLAEVWSTTRRPWRSSSSRRTTARWCSSSAWPRATTAG